MKTAREFFDTHQELHARLRTGKIGVRKFEKAVDANFEEARASGDEVYREMGALIIADIRRAMAETRTFLATEGITWRDADGREKTLRVRGQAWEVTTR